MRRPFENPYARPIRVSARGAWLAVLALASTSFGVAGLVEPPPAPTDHTRWSCTRDDVPPDAACTARALHDGGLWKLGL